MSRKILEVSKENLDEEWALQPERYYEAARDLADAQAELDAAEDAHELVEAQVDLDIRRDPEGHGLPKVTEAAVKNTVILSKPYQASKRRIREAQEAVNKLKALVIALDHKKKALEGMVHLHGQAYFSRPQPPRDQAQEFHSRERDRVLASREPRT